MKTTRILLPCNRRPDAVAPGRWGPLADSGPIVGSIAGLTLIELLVVLAILAITATVALRTTGTMVDQVRFDKSRQTVDSFHDAILGPSNLRQADDTPSVVGFVADMGRLPGAWNLVIQSNNSLTLNELTTQRSGTPTYSLYQATAANIVTALNTNADSGVVTPAGWRGPYLRLPSGQDTFRDGWGSMIGNILPLVSDPFPALFTFPTVFNTAVSNGPLPALAYAAADRDPVAGVAVRGPSYRLDTISGTLVQDVLTSEITTADVQSSLQVLVNIVDPSSLTFGPARTTTVTNSFLIARLYGPNAAAVNPGDPPLDVALQTLGTTATLITNNPATLYFISTGVAGVLTPGPRTVRVQCGRKTGSPSTNTWSAPYTINLRPGFNSLTVKVTGYQ